MDVVTRIRCRRGADGDCARGRCSRQGAERGQRGARLSASSGVRGRPSALRCGALAVARVRCGAAPSLSRGFAAVRRPRCREGSLRCSGSWPCGRTRYAACAAALGRRPQVRSRSALGSARATSPVRLAVRTGAPPAARPRLRSHRSGAPRFGSWHAASRRCDISIAHALDEKSIACLRRRPLRRGWVAGGAPMHSRSAQGLRPARPAGVLRALTRGRRPSAAAQAA